MKNNLHTISAHLPFADTLAAWMLATFGADPLVLPRALVLLPSRRSAQGLREAFLRVSGGRPLLLPRIETLGDADEDALLVSPLGGQLPEVPPDELFDLRRLFLLARLVQRQREKMLGRSERMDHAVRLSGELARLMDELEREEISLADLKGIVPDAYAKHWQATVEFLQILSEHWPQIAREQGLLSPGRYRAQVLRALGEHWQAAPPAAPVIVAGTTGSIPSTMALIKAVSGLPQGHIILPGLDLQADEDYFAHLDESHPQWGMARLLGALKKERADVSSIGEEASARVRLMSEVMRPAEVSDAWGKRDADASALAGMRYVACASLQEEAGAIALMLREVLETPGRTGALVTHNRSLARRVAADMRRFDVVIDDSAGMPLEETPLAAFLRLILDAAEESLAPLQVLSLLKHPMARLGFERIVCLETARALEVKVLRGLALGGGVEGMRQSLLKCRDVPAEVFALLDKLEEAFAPLLAVLGQEEASLVELLDAHIATAEKLGGDEIWDVPEAEAVSDSLSAARGAALADDIRIEADAYSGILEELFAGAVLRPDYGTHPRVKILSPMEARMQSFDRVILGGLTEGSWPPALNSDPWFSRPMRLALGLPAPERRVGLAAHDFCMLACAPEVILTHAAKEDGVPATQSRWLTRLRMLAEDLPDGAHWAGWAREMNASDEVNPIRPPEPRPPLSARPRELSVTQVETLVRDPYAIYAAQILRLRALKPIGRAPDGSDFGTAVHKALEKFVRAFPAALPRDALAKLFVEGRAAFAELFAGSGPEILWWPRFMRIAEWIVAREDERRGELTRVRSEVDIACDFGGFLLKGRADRMEDGNDGSLAIVDYKTGTLPKKKEIEQGLASQLVLLALIDRENESRGLPEGDAPDRAIRLEYWQLQGRGEAGKIDPVAEAKIDGLIEEAREGLLALIAKFSDPDFPYRSTPIPSRASKYSDYEHLARVKEWG